METKSNVRHPVLSLEAADSSDMTVSLHGVTTQKTISITMIIYARPEVYTLKFLHVRHNTNNMFVARLVSAVLQTVSFFSAFLIVFINLLHNLIHIFITPSSYADLNMKVQPLPFIMIINCSVLFLFYTYICSFVLFMFLLFEKLV
jgi:hypothetical protein